MITSGKGPVSLSQDISMDRTGLEPASHYSTGKHVTSYTTGPSRF